MVDFHHHDCTYTPMTSALFNPPPSPAEPPWQHRLTIALLILLGSLIMINSSSVVDTARDIYNAWQIATAGNFPLEGPHVGAVVHGGPIWFYVLATPLLFTSSWVVMSLWVGLLTALKYALAYACGSRLGDRNFGLIWACLLALPNWTSINYLIFSHTNLVETTVLLSFYSLIRWQQGSTGWFFVLCLALGIGIHAHPTVYAAGVVALPVVIASLWRRQLPWTHVILGAVLVAAPLLPYLISQYVQQWPDLQTSQGYLKSQPLWHNLTGFFDVMQGALMDGPVIALQHVLGLQGALLYLAYALLGLLLSAGLGLGLYAALRRRGDRVAQVLLAVTLTFIACVALIRNVTPFYMTLVIYPPFYGLVARGWSQGMAKSGFRLTPGLSAIAVLSLSGFFFATLITGRQGHLFIPQLSLIDVRAHALDDFTETIYFPAWGRQQLGTFICSQPQPVYFHGYASLVLEQSYALEARMRCDSSAVFIGGQGSGRHYIGISRWDAAHLAIRPVITAGSMGLYPVTQVIMPEQPLTIPVGDVYPPRAYFWTGKDKVTTRFTSGADEWLAITNLFYFWMPSSFIVSLNGQPVEPVYRTALSAWFHCSDCSAGAVQNWSVTITAPQAQRVELVTFAPGPKKRGQVK